MHWAVSLLLAVCLLSNRTIGACAFSCRQKHVSHGIVCECTLENLCDAIPAADNFKVGSAVVITSQSLDVPNSIGYLSVATAAVKSEQHQSGMQSRQPSDAISEGSHATFGTPILGFGGGFTDSVAYHLFHTIRNERFRATLVDRYFHPKFGIGYSTGRLPMGSTDFSQQSYSLHEAGVEDETLSQFCIRDDRPRCGSGTSNTTNSSSPTSKCASCGSDYKLDVIKMAAISSGKQTGKNPTNLRVFFSPWSAPRYMKTSRKYAGGSLNMKDPRIPELWAKMFVKFALECGKLGIDLWGLTVQNEPTKNTRWEHMNWNAVDISHFLFTYLGPSVRNNPLVAELQLIAYDDQPCTIKSFQGKMLELARQNPKYFEYIDGIGYHWYTTLAGSMENTTCFFGNIGGGLGVRETVEELSRSTDKKESNVYLLATEASHGYLPFSFGGDLGPGPKPGSWNLGYRYSHDILTQLKNGAAGWTDWNLWLDTSGGPNHSGNNLDAPILLEPNGNSYWLQPMYFHIAHFAKYIPVGSTQVPCEVNLKHGSHSLEYVAFLHPDNAKITVVLLNDSLVKQSKRSAQVDDVTIRAWDQHGERVVTTSTSIPAHAIQTLVIPLPALSIEVS